MRTPAARVEAGTGPAPPSSTGRRRSRWVIAATAAVAAVVLGGGAAAAIVLTHQPKQGHDNPAASYDPCHLDLAIQYADVTIDVTVVADHLADADPDDHAHSDRQPGGRAERGNSMDSLLSSGATSSELLSEATTDAKNCSSPALANDVNEIQVVRNQRNTELTQAQSLTPRTCRMARSSRSELIAALQDSLTADGHYLTWAQQQANPSTCVERRSTANRHRRQRRPLPIRPRSWALWNPIAAQYGLQSRGTGDM